jgi:hypothetical protein
MFFLQAAEAAFFASRPILSHLAFRCFGAPRPVCKAAFEQSFRDCVHPRMSALGDKTSEIIIQ